MEFKQDEDIVKARATNFLATSNNSIITAKAAFHTWIMNDRSKHYNPNSIVASWDNVSDQLLRRKLLSVPLWEITNKDVFLDVYKKVMNDKLFWVTDRDTYTFFVLIGQLYLKYLKSKPVLHKAVCFNATVDTEPTGSVAVLNEQSYTTLLRVNFSRPELCAQTCPVTLVYSSPESNMGINDDVKVAVVSVLKERFPNGIRPKSVIDINKLRNFYREATGEEIPPETEIASLLNTIGIHHCDKVFAVSSSDKNCLTELINSLIAAGHRVFYYNEFCDIHADYLEQMHIFSAGLLRAVLTSFLPSLHYTKAYYSLTNCESAEKEVLRCYDTAVCLSYAQLKEKLPYVPLEKIRQVLAQNSDFIWVKTGVYTHKSKFVIDEFEQRAVERKIEEKIAEQGYVSLSTIDVLNILELNPELSQSAVKNGLFQVCFAERYEKRGKIITPKGMMLNSVALFEDYCLSHDRLTLNELLNFEKEISGRVHSQSLFVAYDKMVRVNKETFVGDSKINFDTEATDNALALFVHTDVIPLQSVTSFTSFPYIEGYPWNWYLLESYCKRFSKLFMYQCLSVNSMNVGAIFLKSAGFTNYIDVLATAVAASNVELNDKAVGDYLFESRYIAQRTGAVSKVVVKARILREKRV